MCLLNLNSLIGGLSLENENEGEIILTQAELEELINDLPKILQELQEYMNK